MNRQEEIKQELAPSVPHVVFHIEGITRDGELVTVAQESHKWDETATIGQVLGGAWAAANKLTTIIVEHVSIEVGMCDGGEHFAAETSESPAITHLRVAG